MLYRAAHVLPVTGKPIGDGGVLIDGGRIKAVGPARELAGAAGAQVEDLGQVALMPGLVNAHCHLELGAIGGAVPPATKFADWIRGVIEAKAALPPEAFADAARAGAEMALTTGTTTLADIVSMDGVAGAPSGLPLRRVVFFEALGFGPRQTAAIQSLERRLADAPTAGPRVSYGVSPHAPYSTGRDVYRACAALAGRVRLPFMTHLAETTEEIEFLELGTGPLRELLDDLHLIEPGWKPERRSPLAFLESVGMPAGRTLVAHMNHPGADDPAKLAAAGVSVAYCPRSHEWFGRGRHPFRDFIDAGVNVCLGTDSLASNSDLSLLEEMRFLHRRNRSLWPAVILKMATINGATALGMGGSVGALEAGHWADMIAVPLSASGPADPLENVLAGDRPPSRVMVAGQTVATN